MLYTSKQRSIFRQTLIEAMTKPENSIGTLVAIDSIRIDEAGEFDSDVLTSII